MTDNIHTIGLTRDELRVSMEVIHNFLETLSTEIEEADSAMERAALLFLQRRALSVVEKMANAALEQAVNTP